MLFSCSDSPTEPAGPDQRLVIDQMGIVVSDDRVDFTFSYYFQGAAGLWTAFSMRVGNTVAERPAVDTDPIPEHEVRLYASFIPLAQPLTPGDSVTVSYRFAGNFYHGSERAGTFDFVDSVRTVVR